MKDYVLYEYGDEVYIKGYVISSTIGNKNSIVYRVSMEDPKGSSWRHAHLTDNKTIQIAHDKLEQTHLSLISDKELLKELMKRGLITKGYEL